MCWKQKKVNFPLEMNKIPSYLPSYSARTSPINRITFTCDSLSQLDVLHFTSIIMGHFKIWGKMGMLDVVHENVNYDPWSIPTWTRHYDRSSSIQCVEFLFNRPIGYCFC